MSTSVAEATAVAAARSDTLRQLSWQRAYSLLVFASDALAVAVGLVAGVVLRFGEPTSATLHGLGYQWVPFLLAPLWLAALVAHGTYRPRLLGAGAAEYKQVVGASFQLAAVVAIICYVGKIQLARGFVAFAFPITLVLLVAGRYAARKWLHARRADGLCSRRVLAVGDPPRVSELIRVMSRERHAGYEVVAACLPGVSAGRAQQLPLDVPVTSSLTHAVAIARELDIDTIAVTASPAVTADEVRRLSWQLEGTGISMLVAPALTDVAGPRIHITQVAGLPLLHVEEPEFSGARRALKEAGDRLFALTLLLLLCPLLAALGAVVRLSSPGPAFFRQRRVGQNGRTFQVLKLRTMSTDAEERLATLRHANDCDPAGVLFKMRHDPRVTALGRWLRRYSLDELPQLWNVVRGDMAVVGPRPPLPAEVDRYGEDVQRRLLVKPGITGLWQVSGRSDLSWDDSVRLDLYYVENWSPALDLMIIWKTLFAVLRGNGAY